ncbi:MAG TPA: hypothetical protein VFQ63_04060 [Patescibacteria group bacterium]|nr:hypothetical protein [Patescibacteria group bacterium]
MAERTYNYFGDRDRNSEQPLCSFEVTQNANGAFIGRVINPTGPIPINIILAFCIEHRDDMFGRDVQVLLQGSEREVYIEDSSKGRSLCEDDPGQRGRRKLGEVGFGFQIPDFQIGQEYKIPFFTRELRRVFMSYLPESIRTDHELSLGQLQGIVFSSLTPPKKK